MHWAREKSTDHADCIVRHLVERGAVDSDGVRHSVKVAWRALALAQTEIEADTAADALDEALKKHPGPGRRYDTAAIKTREDYPSRWLMRGPDGCEWETSNVYTYCEIEILFPGSSPMLRLPPDDRTTAC
jgi:hypothetical protein